MNACQKLRLLRIILVKYVKNRYERNNNQSKSGIQLIGLHYSFFYHFNQIKVHANRIGCWIVSFDQTPTSSYHFPTSILFRFFLQVSSWISMTMLVYETYFIETHTCNLLQFFSFYYCCSQFLAGQCYLINSYFSALCLCGFV